MKSPYRITGIGISSVYLPKILVDFSYGKCRTHGSFMANKYPGYATTPGIPISKTKNHLLLGVSKNRKP